MRSNTKKETEMTSILARHGAVLAGAILISAATCLFAAEAAPKAGGEQDPVLAKGKTFEIRQSQVDDAFRQAVASGQARGQAIPDDAKAEVRGQLLQRLIVTSALVSKATPDDRAKAKDVVAKFVADARKRSGTEEAFLGQLKLSGMTLAQFEARLSEQALAEQVIERDVKTMITISDDQVKKFYEENEARFGKPEQVRASHILLMTQDPATGKDLGDADKKEKKKKIDALLVRARKGEDFAKLAKENSEDPGSKDNGGEYTFPRGQMVPEFEKTAFGLKTNEVSDVVTTQFGYHIIKLSEKIPGEKTELAKVTDDIRRMLTQKEFQSHQEEYFTKLKKETGVVETAPPAGVPDAVGSKPAAK